MPEPPVECEKSTEEKSSKILDFFSSSVKETKKEKIKPLSKIVIRRLPPRLTKEVFLTEFNVPPHDYLSFVRGDLSLGAHSFSRAYINFTDPKDIFAFRETYDDYLLQDEQGKEYHAVVEWAPLQRIPKKNSQKKYAKTGTIETDPRYIEFLEKLEKEKNSAGNSSEYFMETENVSSKEAKITTTPLLEFLKLKRQQRMEQRNENKIKKREAEKERRRKEDELRKERLRKAKEKDKLKVEDKEETKSDKHEIKKSPKDEVKPIKSLDIKEKKQESKPLRGDKPEKGDGKTSRREDKPEKRDKTGRRTEFDNAPKQNAKETEPAVKESEKHIDPVTKETRVPDDRKSNRGPQFSSRKSAKSSVDDQVEPSFERKSGSDKYHQDEAKKEPARTSETKSRFRYSEQRNRDREVRNQRQTAKKEEMPTEDNKSKDDNVEFAAPRVRRQSTQETSDGSGEGDDRPQEQTGNRKDPRTERKIRNKDRPSMQIYRPGMGKFSKQRLEQKKDEAEPGSESEDKKTDASAKTRQVRPRDEDIKPFKAQKKIDGTSGIPCGQGPPEPAEDASGSEKDPDLEVKEVTSQIDSLQVSETNNLDSNAQAIDEAVKNDEIKDENNGDS